MAIWLKNGAMPSAAMAFIWEGSGRRDRRDRYTVLKRVRYPMTMSPDTICPIMVASAAPAIPIWKPKMKRGSNIVLMTAPARVHTMEYLGLPSARTRLEPPVARIRKGNPRLVIPV